MNILPTDPVRRSRVILLLIAGAFLMPLVAGWLAHQFGMSSGRTSNYGELLQPVALPEATAVLPGGAARTLSAFRGHWVLLHFDAPACDADCERKHYFVRQVRKAQGTGQDRVSRVWVLTAPGEPSARLASAIEGTAIVHRPSRALLAVFPYRQRLEDHIYVVDPRGQLMMRYPRHPDPSRMVRDLQRLLKYAAPG